MTRKRTRKPEQTLVEPAPVVRAGHTEDPKAPATNLREIRVSPAYQRPIGAGFAIR